MKLQQEFIKLPIAIDQHRLRHEVEALPASAWQTHPEGFPGNSAVPLISVRGRNNDDFSGPMAPTNHLLACPYTQQVLAQFQVPLGRVRLMRIAAGGQVPLHCDINYHWFTRVRIHIPVITDPAVSFYCNEKTIHMAAGEAWIFDNWLQHRVDNPTDVDRVHLVADTHGSAVFWSQVDRVLDASREGEDISTSPVVFEPDLEVSVMAEQVNTPEVMSPAELEWLAEDLLADVTAAKFNKIGNVTLFVDAVKAFCRDWRMLWSLFGPDEQGWPQYQDLRSRLLSDLEKIPEPLGMSSNGTNASRVLLARILAASLPIPIVKPTTKNG